jgi:succinoglycan biosynthesis protein ExoM
MPALHLTDPHLEAMTQTGFDSSGLIASSACTQSSEAKLEEITVCICTYKRPELLERLLYALAIQRTDNRFMFTCAIVDNDASGSALPVVEKLRSTFPVAVRFAVEPARNFATARNRALSLVEGTLLAFIDDDEVPREDWLLQLWRTLHQYRVDAVLGPVRPYFESSPPTWIVKSRICERPSHVTGTKLHWKETRTGNVLLRADVLTKDGICFDSAFATGGEDVDFFKRAAQAGKTFVWCEEAPAYELVPEVRLRRSYHLKRALLQGELSSKYVAEEQPSSLGMYRVVAKALIATASYSVALPFLFLAGDHIGMKYLIKDCHHIARLLAIFRIRRSTDRVF